MIIQLNVLECLKLQRNVEHYTILQTEGNQSTQTDEEDRKLFIYTKSALEVLGFTVNDIVDIFRVIAVVLKLGNIQFVPCNNIDGTDGSNINNEFGKAKQLFISLNIKIDSSQSYLRYANYSARSLDGCNVH